MREQHLTYLFKEYYFIRSIQYETVRKGRHFNFPWSQNMLEYCAKTAVYDSILEQNARFRPIYGSLRRSVMIDLCYFKTITLIKTRVKIIFLKLKCHH